MKRTILTAISLLLLQCGLGQSSHTYQKSIAIEFTSAEELSEFVKKNSIEKHKTVFTIPQIGLLVLDSDYFQLKPEITFPREGESGIKLVTTLIQSSGQWNVRRNQIILRLQEGHSIEELLKSDQGNSLNLRVIHNELSAHRIYVLSFDTSLMGERDEVAKALLSTGLILYAEFNDFVVSVSETNDSFYENQWALNNTGQYNGDSGADINVELAWEYTTGSPDISIAVWDTWSSTADFSHPDLSFSEIFDATGQGFSATGYASDSHGILCAGIIGGIQNNSIGVTGVCPNAQIQAVKIGVSIANSSFIAEPFWLVNAAYWCMNNSDIISNSNSGGTFSSVAFQNALVDITNNGREGLGLIFCSSAGNDNLNSVAYPAIYPSVIAVGATSMCDERKSPFSCDDEWWWGSNYGNGLSVGAPGVKIYTTDIAGPTGASLGDYSSNFNGTSASCPFVAGTFGLVLSVNPSLSLNEARQLVESTCDKVGGYNYSLNPQHPNGTWSTQLGYGRINAGVAVEGALVDNTCETCLNACTLVSSTNCSPYYGNLLFADSEYNTQASCDSFSGNPAMEDLWFKFTSTSNSALISIESMCGSSGADFVFSVFSGICNQSLNEIYCADPTGTVNIYASLNDLIVGQEYLIRLYDYGSQPPLCGDFSICVSQTDDSSLCQQPVISSLLSPSPNEISLIVNSSNPTQSIYEIRYRETNNSSWNNVSSANSNITLSFLNCATTYEVQAKSICENNSESTWTNSQFSTTQVCPLPCSSPSSFTLLSLSEFDAQISFNQPTNSISFNVRYKDVLTTDWVYTSTNNPIIYLPDLECSTQYEFEVSSVCQSNESSWSQPFQFGTLDCQENCFPPGDIQLTQSAANEITLAFFPYSSPNQLDCRYRQNGSTTWQYVYSFFGPLTITNLNCDTSYEVQARRNCNGQFSAWSDSYFFSTSPCSAQCSPPDFISFPSVTSTSMILIFSSSLNASSYEVRHRSSGSTAWINSMTNSNTGLILDLTCSTNYEFQVRALCSDGSMSPWSFSFFQSTLDCSCASPLWYSTSSISETSVTLNYQWVTNEFFECRYRPTNTAQWSYINSNSSNTFLTGLTCATSYEWQVRAHCGASNISAWSPSQFFATLTCTNICSVPSFLSVFNTTTNSINTTHWSVAEAIDYTLRYRPEGSPNWTSIISSSTSSVISGLSCSTLYEIQAKSNCENEVTSNWSSSLYFNTLSCENTCEPPANMFEILSDTDLLVIGWEQSPSALGYEVRHRAIGSSWTYDSDYTIGENTTYSYYYNLQCSSFHEFQIRTLCNYQGGYSSWSPVYYFETDASPSSPMMLSPVNNQMVTSYEFNNNGTLIDSALEFSIDHSYSTYEYQVQINTVNNFNNPPWDAVTPLYNFIWWNFPNNGQTYYWRIRRNTCAGWSNWSTPQSFIMSISNTVTQNEFESIRIYPNPSDRMVTLECTDVPIEYVLYNDLGASVLSGKSASNSTTIDVSNFPNGLYIIRVVANNRASTSKVIIAR